MIHYFDGFISPIGVNALGTNNFSPLKDTVNPPTADNSSTGFVKQGAGGLHLNAGPVVSNRVFRAYPLTPKKSTAFGSGPVVMGFRATLNRASVIARIGTTDVYGNWSLVSDYNTYSPSASFPFLYVTNHRNGVTSIGLGNTSSAINAIQTGVTSPLRDYNLSHIDLTQEHFFEIVYDFSQSTVSFYIDDLLQDTYYTPLISSPQYYSPTTAYKAGFAVVGLTPVNDSPPSTCSLDCVYVASERLGPVRVSMKKPASDIAVDSKFGEGPHYSNVADADSATKMTTDASATATFSLDNPVSADVLAVTAYSQFSSRHISPKQSTATGRMIIDQSKLAPVSIPVGIGVAPGTPVKDMQLLETNPATGQAWTPEEINNVTLGVEIDVTVIN